MRQLYIRKKQWEVKKVSYSGPYYLNKHIRANCSILAAILLQNAEFPFDAKNLIDIGKVFSYLTVILPNMGNRTGGECD